MKNLLSNSRFLHFFYGNIVLLLVLYIYLTHTPSAHLEALSAVIKEDRVCIEKSAFKTEDDFKELSRAYKSAITLKLWEETQKTMEVSQRQAKLLDSLILSFKEHLKSYNSLTINTSIPTKTFFSAKAEAEHIEKMKNYFENCSSILNDKHTIKRLKEGNNLYGKNKFDFRTLPANHAILALERQKNEVQLFKNSLIECLFISIGCTLDLKFDKYLIVIAPNAGAIKEGDFFNADIALSTYPSNVTSNNIKISVNGKDLKMKEGIAHFQQRYNKAGKYKITASGSIKNPLTEITETVKRDFVFEVLPK